MRKKKLKFRDLSVVIVMVVVTLGLGIFLGNGLFTDAKVLQEENQPQKVTQSKKIVQPQKMEPKAAIPPKIDGKTVFLTFDDGPTVYLNQFIDVLKQAEVPATFFFVGKNINNLDQNTAKRLADKDFSLGLHSYTHNSKLLYRANNPTFIPEMKQAQQVLKTKTGITTNLIRASYGSTYLSNQQYQEVKKAGFKLLDWNIDSNDWRYKNDSNGVIESVMTQVDKKKNSNQPLVILFHERKNTLQALPTIIQQLKAKGYTFQPYFEKTAFQECFKER
ncbi:polysaccharide deacetylase family protein [Listeria sp. PSOL-1]|uniref:polysaccharide deacetylase family protein n=1 Tax=Listeria sp. PSOL-1 TaxID=1844999 RepID=UPI0013D27CB1|nr:polysaccharide deacetylase family protein [Listeria sp. PSOL-1]